ncbi:MAG: N-acetyltransferase [Calditrichaeota bacterium]|nr:N-acetyltransferase [Calditrichota bacterium]
MTDVETVAKRRVRKAETGEREKGARESSTLQLRPARIPDATQIVQLIARYANRGMMLHRPYGEVLENIRDFVVAVDRGRVVGCGALHVVWDDVAEIRSLAVAEEYAGRGIGRAIVEALVVEAERLGLPRVFTLTYQQAFFEKLGFVVVDRETLPHKFWKDCFKCVKFAYCDEVAMARELE